MPSSLEAGLANRLPTLGRYLLMCRPVGGGVRQGAGFCYSRAMRCRQSGRMCVLRLIALFVCMAPVVWSYVPSELCMREDNVRKRCLKWLSTPKNDVLYSYVQTSKAATCAINRLTSRLECWGDDAESTFTPNEMEFQFKDLAMGYRHICGIDKRTSFLKCWGRGDASLVPPLLSANELGTVIEGPYDNFATMLKKNSVVCFGKQDKVSPQPTKFVAVVVPEGERSPAGEDTQYWSLLFALT